MIPVVVCAHNEGPRVGAVVKVLIASKLFSPVLVVDDGSSDNTAEAAKNAGAKVLKLNPNRGKGSAMQAGWRATGSGDVAFIDADLKNLSQEHLQRLYEGYLAGYDMSCGMQDYLPILTATYPLFPLITGQRIVRKRVLENMPSNCWDGYNVEIAMNHACDKIGVKTYLCILPGLLNTLKESKSGGVLSGLRSNYKMLSGIFRTKRVLRGTGGFSCKRQ